MIKRILKVLGILVLSIGIVWFLQPVFKYGLNLGNYFGVFVCLLGIGIIVFYKRIADKGKMKKVIIRFITSFYIIGIVWCGILSGLMLSVQYASPPESANVIVLGAQVYSENSVSLTVAQRVKKAETYLKNNKENICIVTGGQGPNEPCTEALAQKNYMMQLGIEENRIIMEDESTNTRQNLENSLIIAKEMNLDNEFLIATQDFHMYRALQIANQVGVKAYPLIAETEPLLFSGYYGRELLSLTKWFAETLFLGGGS